MAVAALLPVPAAMTGQNPQTDVQHESSWAVPLIDNAPLVDVATEQPPTTSAAVATDRAANQSEHRHVTRKKRAVIGKTRHERVLEISANTSYDVPLAALQAYRTAASSVASSDPSCHLSWGVVAAIGQVESNHGRFGGAAVLANGETSPRIVGLALNGRGVASIPDTDNGMYDGDKVWDRAVGPMQFIPSTWVGLGLDGDGDGRRNPSDFDDAALTTAHYLCSGTVDMTVLGQARGAVLRYNHSQEYVDLVLSIANVYDSGVVDIVPNDPAPVHQPKHHGHQKPSHHTRHQDATRHQNRPRHHRPEAQHPDPTPSPKPHDTTPRPKPTPKPDPPKPKPKPGPPPAPVLRLVNSVFYLGSDRLNLGASPDLTSVQGDYNGNAVACEAVFEELRSLVGTALQVTYDGSGVVAQINQLPYSATAVAAPCPTQTPTPTPTPPTTTPPATPQSPPSQPPTTPESTPPAPPAQPAD